MINSAYSVQWVSNLQLIKQAKRWYKSGMIEQDQFNTISEAYKVPLFHPNIVIRILLFIATLFATSGASGVIILMFSEGGEIMISIICILFAIASFIILERVFIKKNHYKSGVTEGIAYMACGFMIGGIGGLFDFDNITVIQLACLLIFSFASFRYLDLLLMLAFMVTFSWILFYQCYEAGGVFKHIIPFVFMIVFSGFYFLIRKYKKRNDLTLWIDNLLVLEVCSLILIYAGGNYLVVRELSVNMMDLVLEPGEDIPFAWLFIFFTIALPVGYFWAGIKTRNSVLIRVALGVIAFSVFTVKYYFLPDNTEVFMMIVGGMLIMAGIILLRYLKQLRNGFTSENLLNSAWANLNVEAFIISQTMGGNQPEKINITETGGGGDSGGGGASSSF